MQFLLHLAPKHGYYDKPCDYGKSRPYCKCKNVGRCRTGRFRITSPLATTFPASVFAKTLRYSKWVSLRSVWCNRNRKASRISSVFSIRDSKVRRFGTLRPAPFLSEVGMHKGEKLRRQPIPSESPVRLGMITPAQSRPSQQ